MTKSLAISPTLSLAALAQRSDKARFKAWTSRIDAWDGKQQSAINLYRGAHSSALRDLVGNSPEDRHFFVVSAGYGLVSLHDYLAPYAATFSAGHPESVARGGGRETAAENMAWWEALNGWRPHGVRGVRSFTAAFKKWPDSIHLLALSAAYLDAISADLARAREHLRHHENLIVISTGKKRHGELNGHVLQPSASLRTLLGGTLVSLNVSLAISLLQSIEPAKLGLLAARRRMKAMQRKAPSRKIPKRRKASDAEVVQFIKRRADEETNISYSPLLHAFRAGGMACEMTRFRGLFQKTVRP